MNSVLEGTSFAVARSTLEIESLREGIHSIAFLGRAEFQRAIAQLEPEMLRRYDCDSVGALMVAALAFDDGPLPEPSVSAPLARIGRFARANWYRELVVRLKALGESARRAVQATGRDPGPRALWRSCVNSGLPERQLAEAAGLGRRGRSGLLLVPGAGPGVVLGLLLMPEISGATDLAEYDGATMDAEAFCGACHACVDSCPTAALSADGTFEKKRCIQYWTSRPGTLPGSVEAEWGSRLYGCDSCTESCPRFGKPASITPSLGLLGPALPAAEIARASDAELRTRFRGTALGMSWIEPESLRRNARLCLARSGVSNSGVFDSHTRAT